MEWHPQQAGETLRKAPEFIESGNSEIYGRRSDLVLAVLQKLGGSGVILSIKPQSIGGYIRLKSR